MKSRKNGPGKSDRKGISLIDAVHKFSNEAKAEAWFIERRWPNGMSCLKCESTAIKPRKSSRKTPLYHCNSCKFDFTAKTGTIMHDSKLPLSKWAIAFYLYSTNLKGVSSMKLHRDLDITQKSAWYLAHRIRETWNRETVGKFFGPVEVDETYIGGKERNKHASKRLQAGRGAVGKQAVVGARDRETNQVTAAPVEGTDWHTLNKFVTGNVHPEAMIYTDEHQSYRDYPNHKADQRPSSTAQASTWTA